MKHKYFSNLIINKYLVKNIEFWNLKHIFEPYYENHKKKFNHFSVGVMWKKIDLLRNKISVPVTITFQETQLFQPR